MRNYEGGEELMVGCCVLNEMLAIISCNRFLFLPPMQWLISKCVCACVCVVFSIYSHAIELEYVYVTGYSKICDFFIHQNDDIG